MKHLRLWILRSILADMKREYEAAKSRQYNPVRSSGRMRGLEVAMEIVSSYM